MKFKKKTVVFNLSTQLQLVLNKHMVKFRTISNEWEVAFGSNTTEYQQILYLITKKEVEALQNLSMFLFFTKMIVTNIDFCNEYTKLMEKFLKRTEKVKKVSKKEDAEILAEEKAFATQTIESVQKLEEIKKK